MNDWQSTHLGRGALPRDLSGFEIEAFFTYSESERRVIDDERRSSALKLALALQIGFLRMTGRLLEALRLVPPALWRHLGAQFEIDAPDLASLRTMYRRRRTLFEQQDLACSVLGFHDVTEAQRRALVRAINAELSRTRDRQRLLQFARRWLYGTFGTEIKRTPESASLGMLNALANVLHAEGEIVNIVRAKKVWNSVIRANAITRSRKHAHATAQLAAR